MTGEATAVERAARWLRAYLVEHGGDAPAREVTAAADAAGIATRTLRRARVLAGVEVARRGFGGGATWLLGDVHRGHGGRDGDAARRHHDLHTHGPHELDAREQSGDGDRPARTLRVPTRRDTFGRPVEHVTVADAASASHWDERAWRSIDEWG